MAADQAAELYKNADIHVLPSSTIGEGYYGIGSIDRDNPNVDEVIASVTEIMQSVVTGMVSTAIRDAEGEQVSVHTGDFVGYSGKQLLSDSPDRETAAKALVERLGAASRDVMLIFFGEQVPQNEAEKLIADLQTQYKNLEIMLNNGAQPVYDYIIVCI
jgi:dihydroxyacetone kinase-like predicted kinase